MSQNLKRYAVHRGALNLQEAVIVGIAVLLVLVGVLASGSGLFSRSDSTEEMSNAGEIMANTRGLLKTSRYLSIQLCGDNDRCIGAVRRRSGQHGGYRHEVFGQCIAEQPLGRQCHGGAGQHIRRAEHSIFSHLYAGTAGSLCAAGAEDERCQQRGVNQYQRQRDQRLCKCIGGGLTVHGG